MKNVFIRFVITLSILTLIPVGVTAILFGVSYLISLLGVDASICLLVSVGVSLWMAIDKKSFK
jgi:hypothetical protein